MKFKVGDKVRILQDEYSDTSHAFNKGDIVTIVEANNDMGTMPYTGVRDDGAWWYLCEDDAELIEE